MGYGSNMVLGLSLFIFSLAMFFYLPNLNFVNWGLDFTTMDVTIQYIFRLGFLTLAFFGLYFGATGGES